MNRSGMSSIDRYRGFAVALISGSIALLSSACSEAANSDTPDREFSFQEASALFADPPKAYRIIQYGKPTEDQVSKWREYGIGGGMAFFHNELRAPSDPRHAPIGKIPEMLARAGEEGFRVWLADDFELLSEFYVPGLDIGIPNPEDMADFPYRQTGSLGSGRPGPGRCGDRL